MKSLNVLSFEGLLSDEAWQLDQIKYLGDSLSIVGLYRLVETQLTKAIVANYPFLDESKRLDVMAGKTNYVKSKRLPSFNAANELRLISNSVKHNDSKASGSLARAHRAG